jgi:flagellar hook protein FlgE
LNAAATQVSAAANNVVNAHSEGYQPQEVRTASVAAGGGTTQAVAGGVLVRVQETAGEVDLAQEAARLIQAKTAYKANATVIRTLDEVARTGIDLAG